MDASGVVAASAVSSCTSGGASVSVDASDPSALGVTGMIGTDASADPAPIDSEPAGVIGAGGDVDGELEVHVCPRRKAPGIPKATAPTSTNNTNHRLPGMDAGASCVGAEVCSVGPCGPSRTG